MSLLCLDCDTRVTGSMVKPGTFWCPKCEKELKMDEVYRVGKRFFQKELPELRKEKVRIKRKKLKGIKQKSKRRNRQ